MKQIFSRQQGITLIEVIFAVSIIAAIVMVIGFSITSYVDARAQLLANTKAIYLAEEGYEVLRALRDDDWDTVDAVPIGDVHYLDVSTSTLAIGSTQEIIDVEFYRSFVFNAVYRDSDDDVVSSTTPGATIDTEILELTVFVDGPTGTTSVTALLSNLYAI
jgi:type II secretory pathway pseudopilin PulG